MTTEQTPAVEEKKWNLVQEITDILSKRGHPRPGDWTRFLSEQVTQVGEDYKYQRFLINRALRLVLGGAPENTMDARYCLVEDGTIEEWLKLFDDGIAGTIVRLALPIALH